ncbi:MAG: DNRLRE domain-containing protein [Bacteroidia bacterium]|jgi:gliding motility-associated-like protein|nr:DNRLRE domain-containing protein [Bacteroidia bacterium]
MRLFRFFIVLLLGPLSLSAQVTIVFQPDSACGKDALAWSLQPANSYPNHHDFLACMWTNNGNPSGCRSFVDFDLAAIPAGVTIVSATLELFHYPSPFNTGHSNLSGPADCWLQRIIQPWQENTLTWNNQPATTTLNQINIPAPVSMTQNYSLNMTQLVQDYLNNPASSFGFMLRLQNESFYRSLLFASSDNPTPQLWPKLTVVYMPTLQPAAGCWSSFDIVEPNSSNQTVLPPDPEVNIPNVFSPNGDQVNDVFVPFVSAGIALTRFSIYNRWGAMVYSSTSEFAWDGNHMNQSPCADGVYYYVIEYSDVFSHAHVKTGFITLIR